MLQTAHDGGGGSPKERRANLPRPEPRPRTQPSPLQKNVPETPFQQKAPLELKKSAPSSRGVSRDMLRNFVAQRDIKEAERRPSIFGGVRDTDITPLVKRRKPANVPLVTPKRPTRGMPEPTSLGMLAELEGIRKIPRPEELDSKNISNKEWLEIYKEYNDKVEAARKKALKRLGTT